jgi:hypothetical protein
MERIVAYLETIEGINGADRRLRKNNNAAAREAMRSALDVAHAAWALIPAEWQGRLMPPPDPEEYLA